MIRKLAVFHPATLFASANTGQEAAARVAQKIGSLCESENIPSNTRFRIRPLSPVHFRAPFGIR